MMKFKMTNDEEEQEQEEEEEEKITRVGGKMPECIGINNHRQASLL